MPRPVRALETIVSSPGRVSVPIRGKRFLDMVVSVTLLLVLALPSKDREGAKIQGNQSGDHEERQREHQQQGHGGDHVEETLAPDRDADPTWR